MKKFTTLSFVAAAILGASISASAADIQGYFRVQSALANDYADGMYVEVRGPFTTAPDCEYTNALTNAGTVMRLRAVEEKPMGGATRYKIGNLSSQGIEVFGAPAADYMEKVTEIATSIKADDYETAAYQLQRQARELGYIATGRAVIQALFEVVASRLDSEVAKLPQEAKDRLGITADQEDLAVFAQRFNQEVSANIDLHAYLEPVGENQYRLYFNWIDCTEVSKFYLANEKNKKSFEIGFECMRQYMSGKDGLGSGEAIDAKEAALWKEWGLDLSKKYSDCFNPETNVYTLSYEKIFADHEVLYNWIKMYVARFFDPEQAPDASVAGINFKDFATEMQKHEIMRGFLAYIPTIMEGQKLYLTNGRFSDGTNEFSTFGTVSDNASRFGLLGSEQAIAASNAAIWNVIPVDENTDNYFAIDIAAHKINKPGETDSHYAAIYFDFPVEAIEGTDVSFLTLDASYALSTSSLEKLGEVEYIDLDNATATKVARLTPMLAVSSDETVESNKVRIPYEAQAGDYDPAVSAPGGFIVSDEEVSVQHSPAMRAASSDANTYGVLLRTSATARHLSGLYDINFDENNSKVYNLTSREASAPVTGVSMSTPWFQETATIPANHAFLIAAKDKRLNSISLGTPSDELLTPSGITDIEAEGMKADTIYDLNGRRVAHPVSGGIYILNGKKILVK